MRSVTQHGRNRKVGHKEAQKCAKKEIGVYWCGWFLGSSDLKKRDRIVCPTLQQSCLLRSGRPLSLRFAAFGDAPLTAQRLASIL